ncbi:PLP-dependent aminotransferase family protein [Clostridium aminobutyricum]|uniref:PLP-dependent aminotransferase family protein n=1 Tax=Clostridium aminobutyricum TaxID=33953 RepID=A0A939D8R3_CLOAM|nr:PLP-dependent aminotransferase family protein [Clostridium aminobutyricum]MBN7773251.1 PLP-dependent aminotransferase family protein [Clostridium aminobutyricum]
MMIIDENSKEPLYAQLYRQLKTDILSGILQSGTKLQSSRCVSAELHISRNTVELAYDQLFAEGLIISIPRRGYYVEKLDIKEYQECENSNHNQEISILNDELKYDFRCGKLLFSELPCGQWHKLLSRCFRNYKDEMTLQKSAFGEIGLRTQIQKYIHKYRNVNCSAEQIVVSVGTQLCLDIICRLIKPMNQETCIAVEEPGYDQSRITFENNGFQLHPMELDKHGAMVQPLMAKDLLAAYITPSHQFPTGTVMSMSRRTEFVKWAMQKETYIIEDDYNCHFQHDLRPIPSLQSLCADRVFYIGSFSDILFPCINVSYMVVPEKLLTKLHRLMDHYAPFAPFLTQKPLELFMGEGHWESHLRKMRKRCRAKNEALVSILKHRFGDSITIRGDHTGSHLLVQVNWPIEESELISRAYHAGIGVYPTSTHWNQSANNKNVSVLLSYGGLSLEDIPIAIEHLYHAWQDSMLGAIQEFDTGSFASC